MSDPKYTASLAVVDKLWLIVGNVDKGVSHFWLREQLTWLAHEIQPPDYWPKNRPTNEEARP